MSYKSHGVNSGIGMIFDFGEKVEIIANTHLVRASLVMSVARTMRDAPVLRLYYTCCEVEISGSDLGGILTDVAEGKTGVVTVDEKTKISFLSDKS